MVQGVPLEVTDTIHGLWRVVKVGPHNAQEREKGDNLLCSQDWERATCQSSLKVKAIMVVESELVKLVHPYQRSLVAKAVRISSKRLSLSHLKEDMRNQSDRSTVDTEESRKESIMAEMARSEAKLAVGCECR